MTGTKISHYQIGEKLGEGGMGMVYKALDLDLDRPVALKFLSPQFSEDEQAKARFIQEAKTASALDHPNICTIYEISQTDDGKLFIAMAYYEGTTLTPKIEAEAFDLKSALNLSTQIAQGLARAHQNNIIHRDIKPSNIIITKHDEAKIVDFGLAKLAGEVRLTRTGETLGTAAYMAPEQIQGLEVDHRSDIFAWGVLFYEMLTGRLPFSGEYEFSLMYSILNEDPESIRTSNPEIPEEVESILNKALAKSPEDRYQKTEELVEDLQTLSSKLHSGYSGDSELHATARSKKPTKVRSTMAPKWLRLGVPLISIFVLLLALSLLLPAGRNVIDHVFDTDGVPNAKHIAVLAFSNIGEKSENQALCDGLVETLTSKLSQLGQFHGSLWVVPASEVRKSNVTTASEAKQLFGANLVIAGSLQTLSDLRRLTMNLINAKNLRQLASRILDDPLGNASILQDEAVVILAEMLNLELRPESQKIITAGATTVPGAYEFYLQGRGYLQDYDRLENVDASIKLFERALLADPNYASAHAGLGEAYLRKFQLTKEVKWVDHAEQSCERAIELSKLLAPAHLTRGMLYNETGKYQKALTEFQKALELDASNADAYRGRASAFVALGQTEEAENIYKKAISIKPDYWGGYNDLGVFYFQQSRYEEAIIQFQHVIELTPQNAKGYRNLGAMYQQLNHLNKAIEYYQKAIEIAPSYSIYSNLATLYFYEGQYKNAARMYENALEIRDSDHRVWGYLASTYKRIPDEKRKAEDAHRRAILQAEEQLQVNPNDQDLLTSLAGYYTEFGERQKTLSFLEKTIQLQPTDPSLVFRIGYIFEQLEMRNEALSWIEKALAKGYLLTEIESNPSLSDLRSDPRFKKIKSKYEK